MYWHLLVIRSCIDFNKLAYLLFIYYDSNNAQIIAPETPACRYSILKKGMKSMLKIEIFSTNKNTRTIFFLYLTCINGSIIFKLELKKELKKVMHAWQ